MAKAKITERSYTKSETKQKEGTRYTKDYPLFNTPYTDAFENNETARKKFLSEEDEQFWIRLKNAADNLYLKDLDIDKLFPDKNDVRYLNAKKRQEKEKERYKANKNDKGHKFKIIELSRLLSPYVKDDKQMGYILNHSGRALTHPMLNRMKELFPCLEQELKNTQKIGVCLNSDLK